MSLFASLTEGDIWSISGIAFGSPINDILDREHNLEELLNEDEILQELKSRNSRLLEFLEKEATIAKLIDYVIIPASAHDDDYRRFKHPYMACEVICMEVPEILDKIVRFRDGEYLARLFTFLDASEPIDNLLAGYFEKILEMLCRKETEVIMGFVNRGKVELFLSFLRHVCNYSIMQVIQRLMLPHIPFSVGSDEQNDNGSETAISIQCNWSFSEEICAELFKEMVQIHDKNTIVSSHISDLLITVIQLSPPNALIITNLCLEEYIYQLFQAALLSSSDVASLENRDDDACAIISISAISVLEALISRLGESIMNPLESKSSLSSCEREANTSALIEATRISVARVIQALIPHLEELSLQLGFYMINNSYGSIVSQSKRSVPRLGQRGLQLVKLIESIVRIADSRLEENLCSSGLYMVVIDLMFYFSLNSLLHLSVQRIVVMAIEGGSAKRDSQKYIFSNCLLLEKIVNALSFTGSRGESSQPDENGQVVNIGPSKPLRGHLILIAQSILNTVQSEDSQCNVGTPSTMVDESSISRNDTSMDSEKSNFNNSLDSEMGSRLGTPSSHLLVSENLVFLRGIIAACPTSQRWDEFAALVLTVYLNRQSYNQYVPEIVSTKLSPQTVLEDYRSEETNGDPSFPFPDSSWDNEYMDEEEEDEIDQKYNDASVSQFVDFTQFPSDKSSDGRSSQVHDQITDLNTFADFSMAFSTVQTNVTEKGLESSDFNAFSSNADIFNEEAG